MIRETSFAIPLIRPLLPEHRLFQDQLIADIRNCGGKLPFSNKYFLSGSELEISIFENPSEYDLYEGRLENDEVRKHYLLVFAVNGEVCEKTINRLIEEIPLDDPHRDHWVAYCKRDVPITSVVLEIQNFFLTSNIAFPGALSTEKGFVFIADKQTSVIIEGVYAEDVWHAREKAIKLRWPRLEQVSILEAWSWLSNAECLKDGIGEGPLGRAIAAFSKIIKTDYSQDGSLDIVWALLGLEALYGKGNVGLREQLVAKTEVLLGKREANKKTFGKMYDFRSRFVHGDIDLPLHYSPYDASPEFEKFHDDLYESENIAVATLIATFQNMIKNKRLILEFNYSLTET